jgi:predicted nucleic-acid-binding protein
MIGLDTSVVLAVLEQGGSPRSKAAGLALKQLEHGECFIHPLVLCEIARALDRALGLDRAKVADYLDYILHAPEFTLERPEAALEALKAYREGSASFPDCLLAALNLAAGCETTVTFDGQTQGSAGFTRLAG